MVVVRPSIFTSPDMLSTMDWEYPHPPRARKLAVMAAQNLGKVISSGKNGRVPAKVANTEGLFRPPPLK
jgi:hypothetical protein